MRARGMTSEDMVPISLPKPQGRLFEEGLERATTPGPGDHAINLTRVELPEPCW